MKMKKQQISKMKRQIGYALRKTQHHGFQRWKNYTN